VNQVFRQALYHTSIIMNPVQSFRIPVSLFLGTYHTNEPDLSISFWSSVHLVSGDLFSQAVAHTVL
jgi:hypothetical protein